MSPARADDDAPDPAAMPPQPGDKVYCRINEDADAVSIDDISPNNYWYH
jgi:hypothetical protein